MDGTLPLISQLRSEGKGSILAYSVEVDLSADKGGEATVEVDYRRNVLEMARSVEAAGDFEDDRVKLGLPRGKTWVAVKLVREPNDARGLYLFLRTDCFTTIG